MSDYSKLQRAEGRIKYLRLMLASQQMYTRQRVKDEDTPVNELRQFISRLRHLINRERIAWQVGDKIDIYNVCKETDKVFNEIKEKCRLE